MKKTLALRTLLASLALMGCGEVTTSPDTVKVGTSDGVAGAGGSAGIVGTAGAGGSAGIVGTAGAGGSAGIVGTAGAGGSAGIVGTAGAGGNICAPTDAIEYLANGDVVCLPPGTGAGGSAGIVGTAGAGGSAGGYVPPTCPYPEINQGGSCILPPTGRPIGTQCDATSECASGVCCNSSSNGDDVCTDVSIYNSCKFPGVLCSDVSECPKVGSPGTFVGGTVSCSTTNTGNPDQLSCVYSAS